MNLQKYQNTLCEVSFYPSEIDASEVNAIGIAVEAGEVLGEVQKVLEGWKFDRDAYLRELNDVLLYTALFAGNNSIQFEDLDITPYPLIKRDHPPTITKRARALFRCADELLSLQERFGKSFDYSMTISSLLYGIGICAVAVNSSLEEVTEFTCMKLLRKVH